MRQKPTRRREILNFYLNLVKLDHSLTNPNIKFKFEYKKYIYQ